MTPTTQETTRRSYVMVTAIFLVLAVALGGLVAGYWVVVLEPRLKAEATSQAEILAQSQANAVAGAIGTSDGGERVRRVVAALDEILLFREAESGAPFFESIELKVDYDVVDAPRGSLDVRRGATKGSGFRTEVALYDPGSYEIVGIATFRVSDRFFRELKSDVKRELTIVALAVLLLLVVVWVAMLLVLRKLHRQRAERERAQYDLFEQEQKYHRLVNSLSAYFVYSRAIDGRLVFVSESASRLFGMEPAELQRRLQDELAMASRPNTTGDERTYALEMPDGEGVFRHLELSEVATFDVDGKLTGFEGIGRDVTSQKLVQEELRQAKDLAETANRAKSQFLANMSHEIRTPLNAIVGMTALAMKQETSPKVREYLDKMRAAARLLAAIIEDVLDLTRIEAGRIEIERVDFDLDELLSELADVVGVRAGQKNIEMLFSAAPDVPRRLRGDPVRIKQILLNLLNNAMKFTNEGEVVVEISMIELRRERAEIRFSVRDSGIGISAQHLPTLFEPFTQVDASNARRFGGAGLGLAISHRLARMMGGDLQVESELGKGSTFSFTAQLDLARGAIGPRRLADEFRDLPVLLADDNASARAVLSTMLQSLSCRVTAVASGEEALVEAARASGAGNPYRLAVLDWRMPGIDGAETASRLSRGPKAMPVILVTAYDREYADRHSEDINVVLHKPVSPSALHDAVITVLQPQTPIERPVRKVPGLRFDGSRVLVVEDNEINRQVARELLTLVGIEVTEAHNGYAALERLAKETFDAVLMDVQMPELDGVETVKAIRTQDVFADLPVIAMTAHAMLGDRERFLEAGMSDYIAKPIEEDELLAVLGRWLQRKTMAIPTPRVVTPRSIPDVLPGLIVGDGLRRTSGKVELYRALLVELKREFDSAGPRLRELLSSGEMTRLMDLLHTLKGSAATLGARRVAEIAAQMEGRLRREEGIDLQPLEEAMTEVSKSIASITEQTTTTAMSTARPRPAESSEGEAIPRLLPIARKLDEHLRHNNLAAMSSFDELKSVASGHFPETIKAIEQSLDRLDFEGARVHLQEIAEVVTEQQG